MGWRDDPFGLDSPTVAESGVIDAPIDDDDADEPGGEPPADEPTVIVYVPSEQVQDQVTPETKVALRYLEDGTLTLPVFTSPEALVAGCGSGQPWIGIPVDRVDEFRELVGAELAVVDPEAAPMDSSVNEGNA